MESIRRDVGGIWEQRLVPADIQQGNGDPQSYSRKDPKSANSLRELRSTAFPSRASR